MEKSTFDCLLFDGELFPFDDSFRCGLLLPVVELNSSETPICSGDGDDVIFLPINFSMR